MRQSIRRFLMVTVSVVLVLAFIIAMTVSYFEARHEVDELFDAELAQTARLLKASFERVGHNHHSLEEEFKGATSASQELPDVDSDVERTRYGHRYERKVLFQVRNAGSILFESEESMLRLDSEPSQGYTEVQVDGQLWYLFTLKDAGYSFTAGERADIRDELAEEMLASYMIPMLISLPIILGLLLWILKVGLVPLNQLARSIRQRGENNFTPIQLKQTPDEILPLVQSLNHLFEQMRNSIEMERRFTAMASHEMRTPISVLKVNAQNALGASSDEERIQHLQDLHQGIDRASRLMEQLLTLSKLEQTELTYEQHDVDLLPLLREEMAALYPLADSHSILVELHDPEDCARVLLKTVPQLLAVVVRNLLENAIKYTPEHGTVIVRVDQQPSHLAINFEDSGPGVPVAERDHIFNRFYRLPNAGIPGSGLGLAIVKRIVDILGAQLLIEDSQALGGLKVELRFERSP